MSIKNKIWYFIGIEHSINAYANLNTEFMSFITDKIGYIKLKNESKHIKFNYYLNNNELLINNNLLGIIILIDDSMIIKTDIIKLHYILCRKTILKNNFNILESNFNILYRNFIIKITDKIYEFNNIHINNMFNKDNILGYIYNYYGIYVLLFFDGTNDNRIILTEIDEYQIRGFVYDNLLKVDATLQIL